MKTLLLTAIAVIVLLGCNKPNKPNNPLSLEEVKTLICGSYEGRYK